MKNNLQKKNHFIVSGMISKMSGQTHIITRLNYKFKLICLSPASFRVEQVVGLFLFMPNSNLVLCCTFCTGSWAKKKVWEKNDF